MASGGQAMFCENCGVEAPTMPVSIYKVTGMLIVMQYQTFSGSMCKNCALKIHRSTQLHNLVLGWWGYISGVVNVVYLTMNFFTWLRIRNMPEVPAGAQVSPHFGQPAPQYVSPATAAQRAQGDQVRNYVMSLAAQGYTDEQVAHALAQGFGLAPDVAVQYVQALRNAPAMPPAPQANAPRFPAQRTPPRLLAPSPSAADIVQREAMAVRRAAEAENARLRQAAAKAKRDAEMTRLAQRAKPQ
ncbi:MAG: hypothetical protein IT462_10775 [Planctomycetes bacterium]|nr:hypothetical protein [Planctomycetota bacterium]